MRKSALIFCLTVFSLLLTSVHSYAKAREKVKHVFMVIFENEDYSSVINLPFFKKLAGEGVNFTKYTAITHPSQPNYIALIAGDTLGFITDLSRTVDARHLGNLLEEGERSWKIYVEDWPGNCFLGDFSGEYVRRHNPFISFTNVQQNPNMCNHIVNATQLWKDLRKNRLPEFSMYIPNLRNDGHDTGAKFADTWYGKTFGPQLKNKNFTDGLLLVTTFDEGGYFENNIIYTSFWGPTVKQGTVATPYNHYDLLRTVEDIYDLDTLGLNDSTSDGMDGWR